MQCDKVKKQKLLDITTEQAQDYRQKHRTNQIIFNKINCFVLPSRTYCHFLTLHTDISAKQGLAFLHHKI